MKRIYQVWWISLFIKLGLAAAIPLSFDEAYYWVWSKHLQLSYFDHPPMVAWLLWIGNLFEPLGHAIRWPVALIGHLSILIWILALKKYIDETRLSWLLYLLLFSPLIGYGSLIATPDVPLIFFWSISTLLAFKIFESHRPFDYALLGASLGLGFCSKYHIVLFAFSLLLYLTFEKKWPSVSKAGALVLVLFGFLFSLPVIIWNFQNNFSSFRFQIDHGFGPQNFEWLGVLVYPIGQIICLFPSTLIQSWKAKIQGPPRFLFYLGWLPLGFFMVSSFRGPVEVNWPAVGHFSIYTLAVIGALHWKSLRPASWFWGVMGVLALIYVSISWYPKSAEKLSEPRYFEPIYHLQKKYTPLYASTYQMASILWYTNKAPIYKLWGMSRYDYYDEIQSGPPSESKFYLVKQSFSPEPEWIKDQGYSIKKLEEIPPIFEVYEVSK